MGLLIRELDDEGGKINSLGARWQKAATALDPN